VRHIDDWLERHDRALTRLAKAFLLLSFIYVAGSVALR
jgi:hypothetical protein